MFNINLPSKNEQTIANNFDRNFDLWNFFSFRSINGYFSFLCMCNVHSALCLMYNAYPRAVSININAFSRTVYIVCWFRYSALVYRFVAVDLSCIPFIVHVFEATTWHKGGVHNELCYLQRNTNHTSRYSFCSFESCVLNTQYTHTRIHTPTNMHIMEIFPSNSIESRNKVSSLIGAKQLIYFLLRWVLR